MNIRFAYATGATLRYRVVRLSDRATYDHGTGDFGDVDSYGDLDEAGDAYTDALDSAAWAAGRYRVDVFEGATVRRRLFWECPSATELAPWAQAVPTTLALVLLDLRQVLVDRGLYADAQADISLDWALPVAGEKAAIWTPGRFAPDPAVDAGAGRYNAVLSGTCALMLAEVAARDALASDYHTLTRQSVGLLDRAEAAQDVLHEHFPVDAEGNHLTEEGLHRVAIGPARDKPQSHWATIVAEYQFAYRQRRS